MATEQVTTATSLTTLSTRSIRKAGREALLPAAFLIVPIGFLMAMVIWPLINEVGLSFTNARLTSPQNGTFVGLDNYRSMARGAALPLVLRNTLTYVVGTAVLALLTGIGAALIVNMQFRGNRVLRGILAAPWAVPGVATALIWLWMFNSETGILNRGLEALSLGPVPWLTAKPFAMMSVIVVTAWVYAPFVMLVTLAALQSVPGEVVEASRVDGASRLGTFTNVTLPHILPTIRLIGLLLIIWGLRRWDLITILTGGGPVNSTNTIVVAVQRQAFEYWRVGVGAAYAVIAIAIATVFSLLYLLAERRERRRLSS